MEETLKRQRLALALLFAGIAGIAADQQPGPVNRLGAPFSDHAVLQRGMPVPVWGWSQPGEKIAVEFADQKKGTTAGKDGKWTVHLDPLEASFQPRDMLVGSTTGNWELSISDVLVGEVWMASGQSNMQWKVTKSSCNKLQVDPKDGVNPIREFEVTSVYAMLHPIEKASGAWKDGDYTNYSAIAFAFAHKLYGELGVPIGILNCSFSQTAIQAWVPRVGFRDGKDEYTQAIYQKVLQTDPTTPEHKAAWGKFYEDIETALGEKRAIATDPPGNMNGNRDASWLFNGRLSPVVQYAIRGAIWNQGYANMGEGLPYYNNLHSLIRGWRIVWDRPDLPVFFHQFYSAGMGRPGEADNTPTIGSSAEMRLGTWLARDIPGAGMASQIDVSGGIHYFSKAVPGQRLALHALKNQYGKDVVVEGPMFKSYKVDGTKLIVEFENAEGGLVVASTEYNAVGKHEDSTGFADPKIIPDGDDQVTLFFLADEDRIWYPATMTVDGEKVVVTSPKVSSPRGVAYATGGVGFQPNLYNKALLPTTPFIYYDNKLVTSETWPDEKLKIDGEEIDPATVGKLNEYRKMPILSTQFRDNAVLQAAMPVTIWGSTRNYGEWQAEPEEGEVVIHFAFGDIKKTIPVTPDMAEWSVALPPMKATSEPRTLKVSCTIDGELVHERVAENIVIGDVFYVAAPPAELSVSEPKPSGQIVRMIERQAKRWANRSPSRFSVAVSRTPENRFASYWQDAEGFAAALGHRVAATSGKPVGIIFMQAGLTSQGKGNPSVDANLLKSWVSPQHLELAPSLIDDHVQLASLRPGNKYYAANARRYADAWKAYWRDYIPEMISTRAVPDGATWGTYPAFAGAVTTEACHTYNVLVHSFTPAAVKGIIFLSSEAMVAGDEGSLFGEQLAALANGWKELFGGNDPHFIYTMPDKALAPKLTPPQKINGKSKAVEVGRWLNVKRGDKEGEAAINKQIMELIDLVVDEVSK